MSEKKVVTPEELKAQSRLSLMATMKAFENLADKIMNLEGRISSGDCEKLDTNALNKAHGNAVQLLNGAIRAVATL